MNHPISERYRQSDKRSLSLHGLFVPTVLCLATLSASSAFAEKTGGLDFTPPTSLAVTAALTL